MLFSVLGPSAPAHIVTIEGQGKPAACILSGRLSDLTLACVGPQLMSTCDSCQVEAFSDYKPGSGGGGGGQAEQKPQQESQPSPSDGGEQAESSSGGGGGGGGNWPSHSVLGLPALSPTMSQGVLPAALDQRAPPAKQSSLGLQAPWGCFLSGSADVQHENFEPPSWAAFVITSAASSSEPERPALQQHTSAGLTPA